MEIEEFEKKRIEWIRGKAEENLKVEEALIRFAKAEIRRERIEKTAEKRKELLEERKEKKKKWKCPNCEIPKHESIGLDTLVYVYPGSTMPQFYCRECGFVNPPGDWERLERNRRLTLIGNRLKEGTPKQRRRKYAKFLY